MEATRILIKLLRQLSVIDPGMSIASASVLAYVALNENKSGGLSGKDIRLALGLTVSAGSRQVSYWTDDTRGKGNGFLSVRTDPVDARRTNITLSPRGRAFINQLEGVEV